MLFQRILMLEKPFTKSEALEVKGYLSGDCGLSREADYKLYVYLYEQMPYGIAKGRDGTPDEWYQEYFRWNDIDDWVDNRTEV
jgi:hypothetical protein